jgi:outer membrane receptor protein involved in Fe transport
MKTILKLLLLLVSIVLSPCVFGQIEATGQGSGVIKGSLIDSLTGKPLEYVAVALRRGSFNKILNGAVTDEKGNFRLEGLGVGEYKLTFSFVGYETKTVNKVNITATNSEYYNKSILLKPAASNLKEVEITAQKQTIEQKIDRIVYNVEKDAGASTQTLNDILRKVPMINVDAEGNPSIRGNTNIQVLINGKPSGIFAASIADALRTIPGDQVVRVEVLTSVSAKYDAEGTAGIINIITKKKQIEGYNGSTNLSGGNLLGNGSFNVNVRTSKIGLSATVGGNRLFPREMTNTIDRLDNFQDRTRLLEQTGESHISRFAGSARFALDYDFNSQNSLTTSFQLAQMSLIGDGSTDVLNALTLKDTQILNRSFRGMTNLKKDKNFDWTTDFKRTFKNPKNELSASVRWSQFNTDGSYFIDETRAITNEYNMREKGLNTGNTNEVTGQIDITRDLGKKITLETGAKNIYRSIGSLSDYMEYNNSKTDYVKNDKRSNDFDYLQNVSSVYAQSNFAVKTNWSFQMGSRLENTYIKSVDIKGEPTDRQYLNWTPSVVVGYSLKKSTTLKFSYNRRIQRPGLAQLNPFINSSDPSNLTQGNISLKPEVVDKLNINLSYYLRGGHN